MGATHQPICVLVSALGGQGGGVLNDWLVAAARIAGFPAQSTYIAGVAQRTGATTYYFELWSERAPRETPEFCLFPSAGAVDLVVALEPMEAGRALRNGFVTAATTVITETARTYSIAEKVVAGDGMAALEPVLAALEAAARRLVRVDTAAAPAGAGGQTNAVLLGAVAASGLLPFPIDDYRKAICESGVAVDSNLAAFEAGLALANAELRSADGASRTAPAGAPPSPLRLPAAVRPVAGAAVERLRDYQDDAYAAQYIERLTGIVNVDAPGRDWRLSALVARRLAAWMSFEDVIRVAQSKTRAGRIARIRAESGARPGEPVQVFDYLKPGLAELGDVLPPALARLVEKRGRETGLSIRLPTSSPLGYGALRTLAALRPWRRRTARFRREQALIESWLAAIRRAARADRYDLACSIAELSSLARGYGTARLGGVAELTAHLASFDAALSHDPEALEAAVAASLRAAAEDPDRHCRPS